MPVAARKGRVAPTGNDNRGIVNERARTQAGLVRVGVVALDGAKVKANAALDANRTARSLAEEVASMLAQAEAVDAEEDTRLGLRRGDELPEGLADRSQRLARLKACRERPEREALRQAARQQEKIDARAAEEQATGRRKRGRKPRPARANVDAEAKANPSDPDSRIMKSRGGYLQGYNAQAVVTRDQIIVASGVTQQANDVHQLVPMIDRSLAVVETVMGENARIGAALADAGYWSHENRLLRAVDCWQDEEPEDRSKFHAEGARNALLDQGADVARDFKAAAGARPDEVVVFSWMEWPDKATRDAGLKKALADPRMQPEDGEGMIFDGRRLIAGGFTMILDV